MQELRVIHGKFRAKLLNKRTKGKQTRLQSCRQNRELVEKPIQDDVIQRTFQAF